MLSEMGASHFWEWLAFSQIEPFGAETGYHQAAIVASVIAETNRDRKKRSRPYSPKDFMPQFGKPKVQSWEEQLHIVTLLNEAFGGKDLRQDKGQS